MSRNYSTSFDILLTRSSRSTSNAVTTFVSLLHRVPKLIKTATTCVLQLRDTLVHEIILREASQKMECHSTLATLHHIEVAMKLGKSFLK